MSLARVDIQQAALFDFQELIAETHELLKREKEFDRKHQALVEARLENARSIGQKFIRFKRVLPHGKFLPFVETEFGMSPRTVQRFMELAGDDDSNATLTSHLGWSVQAELRSAPETVIRMVETKQIPPTQAAIREAKRNVDNIPIAVPHISSKNNEWYTPAKYVEAARKLMDGIDIDPASCEEANRIIKAEKFYTKKDDGLNQPWRGRVWLNPPYGIDGGSNQERWSRTLIERYEITRSVAEAVLLVNAAVDTKWFHRLFDYPVCLTLGRVNFSTPDPNASGSTHGSAFVYFGPKPDTFVEIFSEFGTIVKRW